MRESERANRVVTLWRGSLVRVNRDVLTYKLHLRGKTWGALRVAVSNDTLVKLRRGEPIAPRSMERIIVQMLKWPELDHAADLLTSEQAKE